MVTGHTNRTVYVIAGPTAVGKTDVAIQLAQRLGTAIISADSRQCYNEMTIGTAKPSAAQLAQVKHYFINEFPVTRPLTAADFERFALSYLDDILQHSNNTAVVCGGTGLYIKALCEGLDNMPEVSEKVQEEVNSAYRMAGLHWLQEAVHAEDPEFYNQAEVQNPARLLRALIFKRSTGESIIHFHSGEKKQRPFNIIKVGLELPRDVLYGRINQRVDRMMAEGLLGEVKALYPQRELKNLQTVGYTELFDHIDGKYTLPEAVEKIQQHTRNYAKRQMTWFRKDEEMVWLNADDAAVVDKILALS